MANNNPFSGLQGAILYKKDTCPYCHKVMAAAQAMGLELTTRDTVADPAARDELLRIGGKGQVPCLITGDQALYESDAIVAHLRQFARA